MEEEIAAILMGTVRSIVFQGSAEAILQRVHVLRNSIVMRMEWRQLHCPIAVCNHILASLRREMHAERRRMMAVVCDLVFSSLLGHNDFFTHYVDFAEGPGALFDRVAPYGPATESDP